MAKPTILYDGACPFCTAQAARLRRLARGRVAIESAYGPDVRDRFPSLPPPGEGGQYGEMKLIDADGCVYGGAAAIARALTTGGGPLGLIARLYHLPPVGVFADRAYAFISKRRQRLVQRRSR